MKYSLTTISLSEKARRDVERQLVPLIGDHFDITYWVYKDYVNAGHSDEKLILITAPVVESLVVESLPPGCKRFVAKRTINPRSIGKLLAIPEGSDVLVVNNNQANVAEVISELKTIGINHLHYHPYLPDTPLRRKYRYAITPDEKHLVPEGIPNIVDIGNRLISLMTIAQIFYHCEESLRMDNFLYERYIRDYVSLSMKLSRNIQHNIMLQKQMELILSNFEDGIIVTGKDQRVTFHNTMASVLLGKTDLVGRNLADVHSDFSQPDGDKTEFLNVDGRAIYVDGKHVALGNGKLIHMITLKDMTTITKVDHQYKRQKKHSSSQARFTFDDIIHKSPAMTWTVTIASHLARNESTILITGESGTGKELLAQSLHNASPRREFPFVAVNCAALTETLLESELFGYEEGAFTGASKGGRRGLFELADRGTIFLDEIGDASPAIQNKMLRVLQEREIMRVSGARTIPVNVRVIAATNRDLQTMVEQGAFRQDLYYRLNVLALRVPPLRERRQDIELLFRHFLDQRGARPLPLGEDFLERLRAYDWPGNIRELQNMAEYLATVTSAGLSASRDLVRLFDERVAPRRASALAPANAPAQTSARTSARTPARTLPPAQADPAGTGEQALFRDPAIHAQALAILHLLVQAGNERRLVGRERLCALLRQQGEELTPQQVKTRLAYLRDQGLVEAFMGKGSVPTQKGLALLRDQA